MKTIILYATKYGATREIAQRIANSLPGAVIYDLKSKPAPLLSQFDCVIIGGSLYAGALLKEVKDYTAQNASELSGKTLGLFLSGMQPDQERINETFKNNFPDELLRHTKAKAFLGGIFDPAKAGWLDKQIFKLAAKQSSYVSNIFDDKIIEFVEALKLGTR